MSFKITELQQEIVLLEHQHNNANNIAQQSLGAIIYIRNKIAQLEKLEQTEPNAETDIKEENLGTNFEKIKKTGRMKKTSDKGVIKNGKIVNESEKQITEV